MKVMQKVLLINPPQSSEIKRVLGLQAAPVGLLYIAAYLEKFGIDVEIVDADLLDLSIFELTKEVKQRSPTMVGVTATTGTIKSALRVVRSVKKALPSLVTIVGGAHATFMPQETLLECVELDLVVRGEGEETMLELTRALEGFQWSDHEDLSLRFTRGDGLEFVSRISNVLGIAFRNPEKPSEVVLTPDRPVIRNLDEIPFPARHLVPYEKYKLLGKEAILGHVITSRGCPFSCTYCSSSKIVGKKYRTRSPENVLEEILFLYDRYKLRDIELIDDIFTLNQKRAIRFSELLKAERKDIRWVASSRVDTISRETMEAMKKAGLMMLYFGVESGSPRILKLMKKGITVEQSTAAFKLSKELDVATTAAFILGYPNETLGEMWQTIKFSIKLDPDFAQFCVLTPFPGTPVYDELKQRGLILTEDWDRYSTLEPVIRYEAFGYTAQDVAKMLRNAYFFFYLRPKFLIKNWRLIPIILRSRIAPYVRSKK